MSNRLTLSSAFRGYNIGIRLIDEFLAKSNVTRCVDFRETAEVIAKVRPSSLVCFTGLITSNMIWQFFVVPSGWPYNLFSLKCFCGTLGQVTAMKLILVVCTIVRRSWCY